MRTSELDVAPRVPALVEGLLVALTALLATSPALAAFDVPRSLALLTLASLGGALIVPLVSRSALPIGVAYAASACGLAVLCLALSGGDIALLQTDLLVVPERLVSETLPLSGGPGLLIPVAVVAWVCAAVTSDLLAKAHASGRPPYGLLAPVVSFAAASLVAARAPDTDWISGIGLVATLFVLALMFTVRLPGVAVSRHIVGSVSAVAVASLLATAIAAGTVAGGSPKAVVRDPTTAAPLLVDPLDSMASLRYGAPGTANKTLVAASLSGPSSGYLATAVLDHYDGGSWTADFAFEPTGGRIPTPHVSGETPDGPLITQRILVEARLPIPTLPVLDGPVWVRGPSVLADSATGMVMPARVGQSHASYQALSPAGSTLADVPPGALVDHPVSAGDDAEVPFDSAPELNLVGRYLAAVTGQRAEPSVSFIAASTRALGQLDRQVVPNPGAGPGVGGTSLSAVVDAVTVNRAATPEQFATFLAVAARHLGVPARVVTGFRLAKSSAGTPLAPGTYRVTGRQAWTWVEIPVVGVGWVVVDPTPDGVTTGPVPSPSPARASEPPPPSKGVNALRVPALSGSHPLGRRVQLGGGESSHATAWPLFIGVAGAIAIAPLPVQAALRRRHRRRRRMAGDPRQVAVGAWLELLDGLRAAGMAAAPSATSGEVAAESARHFLPSMKHAVAEVGSIADRALFDTGGVVCAEEAAGAWAAQRSIVQQAVGTLDRRQRLRAMIAVGRPRDR